MSRSSDMRDIRDQLTEQGFEIEIVRNGHWKVVNPKTGRKCQIASTPRDNRSVLNAITRLKRIGFVPKKK